MNDKGPRMVQVFTGGGKGKTAAAMGSVMRAWGYGLKTCVIYFVNGRYWLGEYRGLAELAGTECFAFGESGLERLGDVGEREMEWGCQALAAAAWAATSGKYDLVVLDDINKAVAWNMVGLEDVLRLIEQKPAAVELILTGEGAPRELTAKVDMVTEIEDDKKRSQGQLAGSPSA